MTRGYILFCLSSSTITLIIMWNLFLRHHRVDSLYYSHYPRYQTKYPYSVAPVHTMTQWHRKIIILFWTAHVEMQLVILLGVKAFFPMFTAFYRIWEELYVKHRQMTNAREYLRTWVFLVQKLSLTQQSYFQTWIKSQVSPWHTYIFPTNCRSEQYISFIP